MIHPPKFGATVKSIDAAAAKAIPGVVDVVQNAARRRGGGRDMWAALKGRDAVTVEWDEASAETRGTTEIMAELPRDGRPRRRRSSRRARATWRRRWPARQMLEAQYEFPYLAHAALEPLNAVARMGEDGVVEVWGGHQAPDLYQMVAAQVAEVDPTRCGFT